MPDSILVGTRCVQHAWHGGCEVLELTCAQAQIDMIFTALDNIYAKVDSCDLRGLRDLKDCLKRSHIEVEWRCEDPGDGAIAETSGNTIKLAPGLFSSGCAFESTIFHELIHHCGGTELDSEALENHCYGGSCGFGPTSSDFEKFRNDGGRFVNWNGTTGQVTTKDGQLLNVDANEFLDPNPPSGGGWI